MRIQGSAPAKLVLLGEYAVLEGAPGLVAALDRRVTVDVDPVGSERWHLRTDLDGGAHVPLRWEGEEPRLADAPDWAESAARVLQFVLQTRGVRPDQLPACDVHIRSDALHLDGGRTKLGLGSSAAVVVALAEAMRYGLRVWGLDRSEPDPLDAYREDLELHHELQGGAGSGIDIAAAFHGGLRSYTRADGTTKPMQLPPEVQMRMVWTGKPASTRRFLEGTAATRVRDRGAYDAAIESLATAAAAGIAACAAGTGEAFLGAVRLHERAMAALGELCALPIVSSTHAQLAAIAKAEGSAYKPSGAGGGDVGLLFATSTEALGKTGQRMQDAGYRLLEPAIDAEGVRVHRHERHTT